jgi:hypothetical protein
VSSPLDYFFTAFASTGSVKIEIKPFNPEGTATVTPKDAKDDTDADDDQVTTLFTNFDASSSFWC